jgi:predicted nucleotidyltransferase
MNREVIINKIVEYLKIYRPNKIGIFGSFSRDEQEFNDIDVLIDFNEPVTLIQLIRMERELSESVGKKIDLVSSNAIKNKKLKKYIERELQIIYQ